MKIERWAEGRLIQQTRDFTPGRPEESARKKLGGDPRKVLTFGAVRSRLSSSKAQGGLNLRR